MRRHIGRTYQDGSYIRYSGHKTCFDTSPGMTTLFLQRLRFWGWEPVKTVPVALANFEYKEAYDCFGTGTHKFKAWITYFVAGQYKSKDSNEITVSCP